MKKIEWQNVTPGGNRTQAASDSKSNTLFSTLTFACKTETLGSLYSHALLILLKSSKSKHQVVHEQKFFFSKIFVEHMSIFGTTDTPVLDFW